MGIIKTITTIATIASVGIGAVKVYKWAKKRNQAPARERTMKDIIEEKNAEKRT